MCERIIVIFAMMQCGGRMVYEGYRYVRFLGAHVEGKKHLFRV